MLEKASRLNSIRLENFSAQGGEWTRMVLTNKGKAVPGIHYLAPVLPGENPIHSITRRLMDGALNERGLYHHDVDPIIKDIIFTSAELSPFFKNKIDRVDLFSKKGRSEIEYFQLRQKPLSSDISKSMLATMYRGQDYEKKALISLDRSSRQKELLQCLEILGSNETPWGLDEKVAAISPKNRPLEEYDIVIIQERSYALMSDAFVEIPSLNSSLNNITQVY